MAYYFVPYQGKRPAALEINGHRLIILSRQADLFREGMDSLGADRVKKVRFGDSEEDEHNTITKLARSSRAGIVIAPGEVHLDEVIRGLEGQLPWIQ